MSSESTVPADIIFQILCHSDPRDIIRWRTVSKAFNAITHELALWITLYKNALFPRPFSTQSVTSLERTLVKAMQLTESWTTRPMRALSTLIVHTDRFFGHPKLICGRWLVIFDSERRFVLHDVDPAAGTHTQRVLWEERGSKLDIFSWYVESIVPLEGHCVVYVFLELRRFPGWKLLELQLDCDTGVLLRSAIIEPPQAGSAHQPYIFAGNSQFLFIPECKLLLDTQTRTFYKVPLITKNTSIYRNGIIVCDTCIITLDPLEDETAIHVFTLPPDSAEGQTSLRTLCHTHEGIIYTYISNFKPIGHAIDPATGVMSIRLLDFSRDLGPIGFQYVEMTLAKSSPGAVLPVNVKMRSIKLPRERVRPSRYESHCKHIDISDDGQIRGFFMADTRPPPPKRPWDTIENRLVMKFTIDTTQDPWVIARGQVAPAEWSREVDPLRDLSERDIAFDGMRGRLCYVHPSIPHAIVVADIE